MTASVPMAARARVNCPRCAKVLTVPPHLAGKRIKCRCGEVFEAPPAAGVAAGLDAAMARGYTPAHKPVKTDDAHPAPKPNTMLDLVLPLVLLPLGLALSYIQPMYFVRHPQSLEAIFGVTTTGIICSLGLMTLAVLGTGVTMGMTLECPMWQMALKICSIALVPSAVGAMLDHLIGGINGNIVNALTAVGLYALLIKLVLRQTWEITGVIVAVCWIVRSLTLYLLFKIAGTNSGSWL